MTQSFDIHVVTMPGAVIGPKRPIGRKCRDNAGRIGFW